MSNAFTLLGSTGNSGLLSSQPFSGSGLFKTPTTTPVVKPAPQPQAQTPGLMSPAYSPTGTPNFSTQAPQAQKPVQTPVAQAPSAPITNIDNVNHTYMQGNQKYALNPSTGRYEAVTNQGVMPTTQTTAPTQTPTPTPTQAPTPTNTAPTVQGDGPVDTSYKGLIEQLVAKTQMSPEELALNQQLADLESARATAVGNEQMMPETNAYQTGRIGIINEVNQAQQKNVAQQAENLATQRGVARDILNNALSAAKPTTGVPYGTQVYDPVTGKFTSGGSAFQGGQISGEQALGQQYAQNVSANNQAMAVKNQIVNFLNTTPINPSDFTDLNSVLGLLSGKVSDPKYAQLSNLLTEYAATLTPILGVGGDNTNLKTEMAQGMLNGRMSPQAIADTLNLIEQTANTKLQQQQFGGMTNTNTQTSVSTPSTSQSYAPGTLNATGQLKWDGTKWVKA